MLAFVRAQPAPVDPSAESVFVGLTRPQRELHLLLSKDDPSPRFRL
jgi:hypothetical protein